VITNTGRLGSAPLTEEDLVVWLTVLPRIPVGLAALSERADRADAAEMYMLADEKRDSKNG
jgi:hypothetical protein